jgi:hypothetical protein
VYRALVLATILAAASACSKPSPSQEAAERFMDLYYHEANVAEAVKLTTGAAKTRLDGELQAIKGVKPDAGSNKPAVGVRLVSSSATASGHASYVYRVDARTADVGQITTTLSLVEENGRWLVSSLTEAQASP